MKNLILLSFILLVAYSNGQQCQVELGPDLTSCPEDSIYLGQNLSIAGMVAPYAYSWESYNSWQIGSSFIETYASDYLDDTTIANPQIVNREQEPLRFILTVTDANGLQCKDSLEVHFSWFMFTLAGPKVEYINQGDSVWLSGMQNIVGMLPPFTYKWTPTRGLTDSTSVTGFWAKPDTITLYKLQVTDSLGCAETGPGSYMVYVSALSIHDYPVTEIVMFPNPAKEAVLISGCDDCKEYRIYSLSGNVVLTGELEEGSMNLSEIKDGVYFIELERSGHKIVKRLIVQK